MAAVNFGISVQTTDVNNLPTSIVEDVHCGSGLFADMAAWVAAYLPLLDATIGTRILYCTLSTTIPLPGGLKAAPVAGVNQMIGGLIRRYTATPIGYDTNEYFGFAPDAFQASPYGALVNLAPTSPFGLLEAFMEGTTSTCQAVGDNGGTFSGIQSAIKNDRSNRRGLVRRHRA